MKLPTWLCFVVLINAGGFRARAQEAASPTPRPTPPAPPFVNETADFSAWSIVRYSIPGLGSQAADAVAQGASGGAKPDSVTSVVKTGAVRHQVRKLKTGEQEDIWYEHGNQIMMESMWRMPVFQGNTSSAKQPVGPDFPELSWIAAKDFVGTQEAQSHTYFVFETQVMEGKAAQAKTYGLELKPTFNRAYIDAETRIPWLLQTGDVLQRHVFQTSPTTPLGVPPEYQAMFDAYERKKIDAARKPPSP